MENLHILQGIFRVYWDYIGSKVAESSGKKDMELKLGIVRRAHEVRKGFSVSSTPVMQGFYGRILVIIEAFSILDQFLQIFEQSLEYGRTSI